MIFLFFQKKHSAWDGAQRNFAVVWSPLIKKTQRVSNHLMHLSDWLPTFYSAAGTTLIILVSTTTFEIFSQSQNNIRSIFLQV